MTSTKAYYMGRSSIGDDGEMWFKADDCPELDSVELRESFKRGVRDIKGELRLNADTEWE